MIRNDGIYKIYIIKHLWKDDSKNEWVYSADCGQWIPKETVRSSSKYKKIKNRFNKFSACGPCWQQTGIFGSYVQRDAIEILDLISKWNPEHRFKVCMIHIHQHIEDIVEQKYNNLATVA